MKKYKLLKDLPLYPAGTICEIRKQDNSLYVDGSESVVKVRDDSFVEIITNLELQSIREGGKFDEWFEEIEESKAWKPEKGGGYYHISFSGATSLDKYNSDELDSCLFEIGNCFKTKEDAERAVEKLKALRRLREKGLRFDHALRYGGELADVRENAGFISISFSNDVACQKDNPMKYEEDIQRDLDLLFKEESEDE